MNLKDLLAKLNDSLAGVKRYLPIFFVGLVAVVYGFLVYRVQALNGQQPSASDIINKGQTAQVLHVDPNVLKQVQALKDNSVNAESLFDTARSSPFKE